MIRFTHPHRVRYRECDRQGVVYHTNYLDWLEVARAEALRAHGVSYREVEDAGVALAVVEASLRYRRPVLYDDEVEIEVALHPPEGTRIVTEYVVRRRGEPDVLHTARVVLCFVDLQRRRPTGAPPAVLEAMARGQAEGAGG